MNAISDYLTHQGVHFDTIEHPNAYTAARLAESVHVKGRNVAKTVLVKTSDGFVIAIVPSTHRVDLAALGTMLNDPRVTLATEADAMNQFPDVERGVVPPFGSHYGLRAFVDAHLVHCPAIVFEGASHHEAIRMSCDDFEMIEKPAVGLIAIGKGCDPDPCASD